MHDFLSKKYQIHVVLNTYDIYEHDERVRKILAETWGMKLRGYKKYFDYGILPMDKYDFISHHIAISEKKTGKIIMGIRSLPLSNCKKCRMSFPVKEHLLYGREDIYSKHSEAIDEWIMSKEPQEVAYSSSFTIDPSLERSEKRLLTDIIFYLFYYFYTDYNIPNIIHGINKRNKLDLRQEAIGFRMLDHKGTPLSHIELEKMDDLKTDIMVVDNLGFKDEHIAKAKMVEQMWLEREEFIGEENQIASQEKKAA